MSLASSIRRNSLFSLLTHFIRLFANFFVFIGIARLYGAEAFGQFTAAHTLSIMFLLLADYGFDTLLVTEIAHNKNKAQQIIHRFFSMKILLATFATALMIVVTSVEPVSNTTRTLMYLFSMNVLFSSLINFFFYLFRSYEEFYQETKISFIMNAFLLVTVIVFGLLHVSILIIATIFIGTRLLGAVIAVISTRNKFNWDTFHFSIVSKQEFLRINIFGLYGIFGTILFSIDTILISVLQNDYQVGLYQSVIKIASLGLLLSDILVYSILPSLTQYFSNDNAKWYRLAKYSHRYLVLVGTFISFFMIVFPTDMINLIYGVNRYDAAVPIMRIFGCVIAVRYYSEAGGLILTSSHCQLNRLIVVIIATIFNFTANILTIPVYGIHGASIIALITNLFVGIGYLFYSRTFREMWFLKTSQYIPFIVACVLGLLFWNGRLLNVWLSIPFSFVIIFLTILFTGFNRVERMKLITWRDSEL